MSKLREHEGIKYHSLTRRKQMDRTKNFRLTDEIFLLIKTLDMCYVNSVM